jgi:hypothetical protein
MALSRPPKAFVPLTVTAGVNDYIDFTINGGVEMSARIAAATYLSVASLLTACETALETESVVTIATGVNDKIDFTPLGSAQRTATVAPGIYTATTLAGAVAQAMTALGPPFAYTANGGGATLVITEFSPGTTGFSLDFGSGPNAATSAAAAMGFTATDKATALSHTAEGPPVLDGQLATWTGAASSTGRVSLSANVGAVVKFSTGTHAATSARDILGFGSVDTASGTTHTGTLQHQNGWYPERPCVFDSREEYERVAAGTVALSGAIKSVVYGSPQETRRVDFAWLPEWKTKIAREGTHTNEAIERLWKDGYARFRYWPDATVEGTYIDVALDGEALKRFSPGRDDKMQLYAYTLSMRKFV